MPSLIGKESGAASHLELFLVRCVALLEGFGTFGCHGQIRRAQMEADFAVCLFLRYYALEVSYFKSSLDRKLLELLWNKYWVNTLSSSSLLTVSTAVRHDMPVAMHQR